MAPKSKLRMGLLIDSARMPAWLYVPSDFTNLRLAPLLARLGMRYIRQTVARECGQLQASTPYRGRLTSAMRVRNAFPLLLVVALSLAACTPRPLVRWADRKFPGCVYDVQTREKVVALTLDDGPDAATTPRLLAVLREHNATATFFLISDQVAGNASLVRRMLAEGHEIGNHFSRKESSIRLNSVAFLRSFLRADTVLRRYAPVHWVRPGSGLYNERMLRTFAEYRYQCALGSVHPFDPQLPFAWYTSRVVLHEVYPGAVIVLHDAGYKGRNTEKALRRILPELSRRGYRVVTLGALMAYASTQ